jgi:hypothetical protein
MNTKLNIKLIVTMQKAFYAENKNGLIGLMVDLIHIRSDCASQVAPIEQWAFRQPNDQYDEYTVLAHGTRWLSLVDRNDGEKLE